MPNPEIAPPKLPPASPVRGDDRPVMCMGILGFGLSIPWLSGLYGAVTPRQGLYWVGTVGFIALAAAIWLGNRWLLFKQREHLDWFRQPLRKLMMLVVLANVLYTAPITVLGLMAYSHSVVNGRSRLRGNTRRFAALERVDPDRSTVAVASFA